MTSICSLRPTRTSGTAVESAFLASMYLEVSLLNSRFFADETGVTGAELIDSGGLFDGDTYNEKLKIVNTY